MRISSGASFAIDRCCRAWIKVLLRVFLKVATILLHIRRDSRAQGLGQRDYILLWRPVDQQRPGFGMDQVVRTGRSNLCQPWRILAAREGQHIFTVFEA